MQSRRIISMILALALLVGVFAPGSLAVYADEEQSLYGENLEQVAAPVIGESYYLGADVDGTMMYFRHGTVTDTVPYSLVVTDNINHNWAFKLTIEDPTATSEKYTEGFQLSYTNPTNDTLSRIYCMDVLKDATVAGQTGVMDTGVNNTTPYKNRHNFFIEDLDGVPVIKSTGNSNILVIKQVPQTVDGVTADAWRMLGVPVEELANEGVYPVMLLQEHVHAFGGDKYEAAGSDGHKMVCWCGAVAAQSEAHTYGESVVNAEENAVTRTCTACGYAETAYSQAVAQADEAVVGNTYYLAANVAGTVMYFRHGTVTDTVPYSLVVTDNINHNWTRLVTLEDPSETSEKYDQGFQLTFINPTNEALSRIYCMDVLKDATVAGQTGVMDTGAATGTAYKNRHNFYIAEVNGVKVLKSTGNGNVLVIKQVPQTVDGETTNVWRMLGVTEAELNNEGVYPVMLTVAHEHDFTSGKPQGEQSGHTGTCWCGVVGEKTEKHTYGEATISGNTATRACTACGYVETVYGEAVVMAEDAVVGNSYYLAANAGGTMVYFRHGTATDTAPYSLVATTNFNHNWVLPVTLEDPTLATEGTEVGFQLTYNRPDTGVLTRIYCYDVLKDTTDVPNQTGVMDTGINTANYKGRHTFMIDEVNGVKVLRKLSNNNILAAKYNETKKEWRMLGVPEAELTSEGVYPVALALAHEHEVGEEINKITDNGHSTVCWCGGAGEEIAHTYGQATINGKVANRTCTECGYVQTVYGQAQVEAKNPVIGESYYLSANVDGVLKYFTTGTVTNTVPYSLVTTERVSGAVQVALEDSTSTSENFEGGFQFTFDNNGTLTRIYCMDVLKDATTAGQTGVMDTGTQSGVAYKNRHSFWIDEVNGVKVLRKYGNDNILVVKKLETTDTYRMLGVPEAELANEGVYPVMLSVNHEHTYDGWTMDTENGTQSKLCTVCGFEGEKLHGTNVKASQVTEPVVGDSYYLGANVNGILKFFTTGTVTNTVPYSLVTTERTSVAVPVTLEDSTSTSENFEGGFQFTFDNNGTLTRIYCMDVLKDATTAGQTGVMDTGTQSGEAYKNRHSFFMDEVGGVKVLRKYGNDNILVVKKLESTNTFRMLGVPEADLANEGVYPVMLMNVHEHAFNEEELLSDSTGHYHLCDCGSKQLTSHSFGDWTLDKEAMQQTAACAVCGYELTVASPYFDTVDSLEELTSGLAETVLNEETGAYTVSGGKDYYLMTEIGDEMFYFRNAGKTAAGNAETVTSTSGYSLYVTADPNHEAILKTQVTPGNTEDTYVVHFVTTKDMALYVNDEGKNGTVDTGLTAFSGVSSNATYIARSEFMWDEQAGYLYQLENDVKYVLVVKEMTATYASGAETATEWRLIAVPAADATPEKGNYPVKLANHVHNLTETYASEGANHWRACPCGYNAYINWSIVPGESIGVNIDLKLEKGETVTVTVAGEEIPVELTDKGYGTYNAFIQLAAAQMKDEIAICVGEDALEQKLSVRSFADMILADESSSDNAKELVKAMLSYGGAAQNYFGYNTENLADEGIDVTVTMPEEAMEVTVEDALDAVRYYGASMVHEGRTALRFYFEAESVEGLTFTVDGNVYEPTEKDGKYYIEIGAINPQNLNQNVNVVVTDGENNLAVQYSPLTYIVRTYQKANASEELKALVQAMYGYHKAAKTYIANMYLGDDFARKSWTKTTLYEGVDQYKNIYVAADYGEVEAYVIKIAADANVELKVSAGSWSESSTAENPGETKTVAKHFRDMKNAGNNVLAMINGGFFDMNANKTMKPYGMQIVDGVVKQVPNADDTAHGDNWFGMTTDGKYVISDAAGYASTYAGNIQQGVGGGKLLMIDGIVQDLTSGRDYRTAVGVNAAGDLVLVAVENATYSDVNQIFVDMDMDIVTVLNLDGGGSTAMYVSGAFYPKALIQGEDGLLPREVADAVGIVVK